MYNTKAINDVLCGVVPSRPVAFRTEESTVLMTCNFRQIQLLRVKERILNRLGTWLMTNLCCNLFYTFVSCIEATTSPSSSRWWWRSGFNTRNTWKLQYSKLALWQLFVTFAEFLSAWKLHYWSREWQGKGKGSRRYWSSGHFQSHHKLPFLVLERLAVWFTYRMTHSTESQHIGSQNKICISYANQ
jgi:hypothetical protein